MKLLTVIIYCIPKKCITLIFLYFNVLPEKHVVLGDGLDGFYFTSINDFDTHIKQPGDITQPWFNPALTGNYILTSPHTPTHALLYIYIKTLQCF